MRPVNMTVQTGPGTFGDCARACVASIFELPSSWVPHFCEPGVEPPGPDGVLPWITRLQAWLRSSGFAPFFVVAADPSQRMPAEALQFHHMRGSLTSKGVEHWVVYFGDTLVHDPHPDSGFQHDAHPLTYLIFVKS